MAFKYGFYNSVAGDRVYDAEDMASILGGIINDGVYSSIGGEFAVSPSTGLNVSVATGRAWLLNTWCYNDSALIVPMTASHASLPRIDTVIIEVNKATGVRANAIKVLQGTAASTPVAPALTNTGTQGQYPLANVLRPKGSSTIVSGNITGRVGTTGVPYATSDLVKPAPPTGRIFKNNGSQSLSVSESGVEIVMNGVEFLKGGVTHSTARGGSLVIPQDGVYHVSSTSHLSGSYDLLAWSEIWVERGSTQIMIQHATRFKNSTEWEQFTSSRLFPLLVGDKVYMKMGLVWNKGRGTCSAWGDSEKTGTGLELFRISP